MNKISVDIDFTKGTLVPNGINLITGDYNSTEIDFTFDEAHEEGRKVFEMKSPSEKVVLLEDIVDNKIPLYGMANVTTTHDEKEYIKYTKDDSFYWYNQDDNELYNNEWTAILDFDLTEYTKVQEIASLFDEEGFYIFEISYYTGNSKLTSVFGKLPVSKEQIVVDGEIVEPYLPIFDELMQQINTAITETNNLNITITTDASGTKTIEITNKSGQTTDAIIEDLQFHWNGTQLGIKTSSQEQYTYVDLQGPQGPAGAIKMIVVDALPQVGATDTIYLVPITPDTTGNNYAEYVYINGAWELLGKIGVQVDLTDYVKFTDIAGVNKKGVIQLDTNYYGVSIDTYGNIAPTSINYETYGGKSSWYFISKGTLENVITGKGLINNQVNNLANYYTKTEIDNTIGDIASVIDLINGESV